MPKFVRLLLYITETLLPTLSKEVVKLLLSQRTELEYKSAENIIQSL